MIDKHNIHDEVVRCLGKHISEFDVNAIMYAYEWWAEHNEKEVKTLIDMPLTYCIGIMLVNRKGYR